MKSILRLVALSSVIFLAAAWAVTRSADSPSAAKSASQAQLTYQVDGQTSTPADYRDWPFLSAGVNMNYAEANAAPDHPMIDNVFVNPDPHRPPARHPECRLSTGSKQ